METRLFIAYALILLMGLAFAAFLYRATRAGRARARQRSARVREERAAVAEARAAAEV